MNKIDKLWAIIEAEGIDVEYDTLWTPKRPLLGIYLPHKEAPLIGLDVGLLKPENTRLHTCILAEEVGHHITVPRTNIVKVYKNYACNVRFITLAQDERKAYYWATSYLMPIVEVCRALRDGCQTAADLADYFEVTEWFVYRKLGFLKAELKKKGVRIKANELLRLEIVPELLVLADIYYPAAR